MITYSDDQLAVAVASSHSWRSVLRALGLRGTSAGAIRSVRRRAELLGLDYSHFTGRRWTDRALAEAVMASDSWADVYARLDLVGDATAAAVRGAALRNGLDTEHLGDRAEQAVPASHEPDLSRLRRAGPLLAAAWFELHGGAVSWPLEPCAYDLLVVTGPEVRRVQVKTTTVPAGNSWTASLSCTSSAGSVYAPDAVDDFFIVAADMSMYLIPMEAVAGRRAVHLSTYQRFRLPSLTPTAPASSC